MYAGELQQAEGASKKHKRFVSQLFKKRNSSSLGYRDNLKVAHPDIVQEVHTGRRGRPKKVISEAFLKEAFAPNRRINQSGLARKLKMCRHTVRKNRIGYGIKNEYSKISDHELDHLVKQYKGPKPKNGWRYVSGFLSSRGFKVQARRIQKSLKRVDCLGVALRVRRGVERKVYSTKRPNALWHCDGHHKLIRWGIVIHGFIDGYCRTVSWSHFIAEFKAHGIVRLLVYGRAQITGRPQFWMSSKLQWMSTKDIHRDLEEIVEERTSRWPFTW